MDVAWDAKVSDRVQVGLFGSGRSAVDQIIVEGDLFYAKFCLAGLNLDSGFGAHLDEDEK
jgi:hypothetical protein